MSHPEDPCFTIREEGREDDEELKVTFHPPLYQQRRMWILDLLRKEGVTQILDIGCGEGQLLEALCQPAPWLPPPPESVLPESPTTSKPSTPTFSTTDDPILSIYPTSVVGLDISEKDLHFAIQGTIPPPPPEILNPPAFMETLNSPIQRTFTSTAASTRWEDLTAKVWKGGLQVVNEEFVDTECIISTEVIEHLPPSIFPFFAPVLMGVYHPRLFMITTPSYTFNARFTSPTAPPSVRKGFRDPTGRTDRIFRHDDHKFEWTREEFHTWCTEVAEEWGYELTASDVGRPVQEDEWGRDEELGGATLVASFRRLEDKVPDREQKAREIVKELSAGLGGDDLTPHELLAEHLHPAHPSAQRPVSLREIGDEVKGTMERYRERFMRLEELWFDGDLAVKCGGWLEILARAVDEHEGLTLKREITGRENWIVELVGGGITQPRLLWPSTEEPVPDRSIDCMPPDWIPEEEAYAESSASEWDDSTAAEGDVSWNNSDEDPEGFDEFDDSEVWTTEDKGWGNNGNWEKDLTVEEHSPWEDATSRKGKEKVRVHSSNSSTGGWEGDESDDTS